VDRLRAVLDAGLDATAPVRGKLPIDCLTEMSRASTGSPRQVLCCSPRANSRHCASCGHSARRLDDSRALTASRGPPKLKIDLSLWTLGSDMV
jgi:hypothetical protein